MKTIVFHPAKDRPKTAVFLAFVLGITLKALLQAMSPPVALALWIALAASLRDFFCPTTYSFNSEGFSVAGPVKISKSYPWRRFRAYESDRNGLFLTPYLNKRISEGARGVFLPLRPEQRATAQKLCGEFGLVKRGAAA